ncbi:unnamed protein product [Symbiodinium natans]|uniref:Uncharacterized protein n=1 Tax=Symbiodinium natans TaxID=878477 RepID=A0A812NR74_9DINO|nr:unnamed protein product [Symbiodinium natans]
MAEQSEASEKKQLELLAERLERLAAEEHSFRLRRAAARGLSPADARRSASASPAKLANRMEKLEQDAQRARRRNDDVGDFCSLAWCLSASGAWGADYGCLRTPPLRVILLTLGASVGQSTAAARDALVGHLLWPIRAKA